jgi:hypothetical protein
VLCRCACHLYVLVIVGINSLNLYVRSYRMCACRCSGSTAVRYGSMRENVLNVTAVLPDGTVIKTGSRARKRFVRVPLHEMN